MQDAEHRNESPRIGSEKASWEAAEGLGKQGKIKAAVFDEDDATLDAIQSGTIAATVVQKPFQFGCLSAKWMHDLATKGDAAKKALLALAGREDGGSKPYGLRHRARIIVVCAHGGDIKAHTQPRTEQVASTRFSSTHAARPVQKCFGCPILHTDAEVSALRSA